MYRWLFLLHLPFWGLQHKPVFLHTVLGINFIWSIYLIHTIHKKNLTVLKVMAGDWSMIRWKCIIRSNFLQLINYILNLVTQVDDVLLFDEICIFLAHLQKLLSRSTHFKTRTFFPTDSFAVSYMGAHCPPQGHSNSVILTYICQLWFCCVKNKMVTTITILASGKSHDISFLPILYFAFAVSIDSNHYGLGENMSN